jgi:hypothetical protein|tara:strand:- start:5200 stop:5685 length:486 start_codon:yes stop_codon:yes gene_type:complete
MATNDILQYLESTDSDGSAYSSATSNRRQVEKFIAAGTIVAGDVVAFSFANGDNPGDAVLNVVKSTADKHCVGVALTGASSGDLIDVCISGVVEAKVDGKNNAGNAGISSGDFLSQGDVAGTFYKFTVGTDAGVDAIAVDDKTSAASEAAAIKTVILIKKF